ncbi:metal ABC transporter solute-binding protein, Zn/Mn family [Candidatus Palauibacter sp.]|uniref:metal ABC transporter solute-binding protein, Zn/Mn family n=1 Tax=Candidatus Palauibacter sp. TaxID=3101350 RepID=UPI003B0135A1
MRRGITSVFLLLIVTALALAIAACSDEPEPTNTPTSALGPANTPTSVPSEPLNVVASIYPMQYFTERIGGDRVEVETIVQPGTEAHGFELTASDLLTIAEADVVVTNGLTLLPWLDRAIESLGDDLSGIVVEAAFPEAALPLEEGADPHGHMEEDEHGHMEEGEHGDEGESAFDGRLLVADLDAQHLSVIDLSTEEVDVGAFEISAPPAAIYPSPTHRYAFVLARGPGEADDGIHIFDGGIFLQEHGDHFDLVREPVSRHPHVATVERPIHFVNTYGWTAVFADAKGYVYLYNEDELSSTQGDYQPIVFETGPQHGAALAISPDEFIVTTKNPDYPENSDDSLPVGVEVLNLDGEVVYDASNRSCPGMHGEIHNEEGAIFGCVGGVLFLHPHGDSYDHDFIENPPGMREDSRIGSFFGHDELHHFFGRASYFDGQGFANDGIWLIDPETGEFRRVFSEAVAAGGIGAHAERLYLLTSEGELHVLDAHDGDEITHLHVMDPGEGGRPSLTIVGETMFITNPGLGEVIALDLEHLEVEETWDIGGSPSGLAFVGTLGEGEGHEDEDEHGHEEEDEHGDEDEDEHGHEDEDEHGDEDDHGHGEYDPHFWLDPLRAISQAERIAEALIEADPEGANVYRANLAALSADLRALHAEFETGLSSCAHREFVTSHSAYAYLALAYDLEQVGIAGLSPEPEPSPQRLAAIADRIKELGITAVLLEPVLSGANEKALADETGAGIYQIHAIESVTQTELDEHGDYLGLMRDNLNSLRIAMECS